MPGTVFKHRRGDSGLPIGVLRRALPEPGLPRQPWVGRPRPEAVSRQNGDFSAEAAALQYPPESSGGRYLIFA